MTGSHARGRGAGYLVTCQVTARMYLSPRVDDLAATAQDANGRTLPVQAVDIFQDCSLSQGTILENVAEAISESDCVQHLVIPGGMVVWWYDCIPATAASLPATSKED